MRAKDREMAVRLRKVDRLSYSAILRRIKVSKSTLSYWLRDLPLTDAEIKTLKTISWHKGEAAREKYRNAMALQRKRKLVEIYRSQKERLLPLTKRDAYIAGLMLYVGEGDKRNPHRVSLANSDPFVITFFTKWLQSFLKIPRKNLRFGLHLYANMKIAEERKFWQDTLGFGRGSFYKDQIRPVRTAFSYTEGYRHGTCTVYVIGSEAKALIMQAIRVFQDHIPRV